MTIDTSKFEPTLRRLVEAEYNKITSRESSSRHGLKPGDTLRVCENGDLDIQSGSADSEKQRERLRETAVRAYAAMGIPEAGAKAIAEREARGW